MEAQPSVARGYWVLGTAGRHARIRIRLEDACFLIVLQPFGLCNHGIGGYLAYIRDLGLFFYSAIAEALRFPDLDWYYEVLRRMEMSGLRSRERRAIGDWFHAGISFNDSPITTMPCARFYFRPRLRDCPRLPLQSQQPAAPLLSGRPRLQGSLPSSKQNRTAGSGLAGPSGCRPRLTQSVF
jgi:hypothetical protein